MKIKSTILLLNNNKGVLGIKQIAVTVAVILIIGAAVTLITNTFLSDWISQVWDMLMRFIEDNITG